MQDNTFLKYSTKIAVGVVIFLLGISIGRQYRAQEVERVLTAPITVSLSIDNGSDRAIVYSNIVATSSETVFSLIKDVAEKNTIDLKYKDFGGSLGAFIESIGGVGKDAEGKKWWQYWVNGVYSQVGVSSYVVKPGDNIEFKYRAGQE